MKRSEASISKGRTYEEIGEYWDSHDLGDVWEETHPVDLVVDIRSQRRYYSVEKSLSDRVQQIARTRGVSPETLVNLWIQEKVAQSG